MSKSKKSVGEIVGGQSSIIGIAALPVALRVAETRPTTWQITSLRKLVTHETEASLSKSIP